MWRTRCSSTVSARIRWRTGTPWDLTPAQSSCPTLLPSFARPPSSRMLFTAEVSNRSSALAAAAIACPRRWDALTCARAHAHTHAPRPLRQPADRRAEPARPLAEAPRPGSRCSSLVYLPVCEGWRGSRLACPHPVCIVGSAVASRFVVSGAPNVAPALLQSRGANQLAAPAQPSASPQPGPAHPDA